MHPHVRCDVLGGHCCLHRWWSFGQLSRQRRYGPLGTQGGCPRKRRHVCRGVGDHGNRCLAESTHLWAVRPFEICLVSKPDTRWPNVFSILVGIGAGLGLCVGPIFLAEIAPTKIQGAVGVLTQFAIVVGIMITQAMGLQLADPHEWRIVLFFSAALSVVQLLLSPAFVESPSWLHRNGLLQEKAAATRKLWAVEETPACQFRRVHAAKLTDVKLL